MFSTWLFALLGGALIGTGGALLFATHGRIAGISGITGGLLQNIPDQAWRFAFLTGLLSVGVVTSVVAPSAIGSSPRPYLALVVAGLLVGFGTRLGGGCTSGHGVCGLSRLSARSLAAVVVFIGTGAVTAMIAGRLS